MKKLFTAVLIILVLALTGYIILRESGYDFNSISNLPSTSQIQISCSNPELSMVTVTVMNTSNTDFTTVKYKVIYFDRHGNQAGEKTGEFLRSLRGQESLTKVVTVPLKAKSCQCIVTDVR
jgi:uncharacterized protein YcfL